MSKSNVVITAMKPGGDGSTILRLYEASGQATPGVTIRSKARIKSANEASLIEDTGRELKVTMNTVQIDFGAFEIKTLKLRFRS